MPFYNLTQLIVIGIQVVKQFRYFRQAKKPDTLGFCGALTIFLAVSIAGCSGGEEDNQTANSTNANVESPGPENTGSENTGSENTGSENTGNENPGSESPGLPDQIDQPLTRPDSTREFVSISPDRTHKSCRE